MDDFRVRIGFADHIKFKKLEGHLGKLASLALIELWSVAARNGGELLGSNEEVCIACRYAGDPDVFIGELLLLGFIRDDMEAKRTFIVADWTTSPERES